MLPPEQRQLIENSYGQIELKLNDFGHRFYHNLFTIAPHTRALFVLDINEQQMKLMQTISFAVSHLHMPAALEASLLSLGQRHVSYGVQAEYFDLVGQALIQTLQDLLNETFTSEVREAWQALYNEIKGIALRAYTV